MDAVKTDIAITNGLRVQKNRAHNTYLAVVDLPDGHRVSFEHFDKEVAIEEVKKLARDYCNATTVGDRQSHQVFRADSISIDGNKLDAKWSIPNDHPMAGIPFSISRSPTENREQLASDIHEQQKVMAGLIEKAKRSGINGRLVAIANTQIEMGFLALNALITYHKE